MRHRRMLAPINTVKHYVHKAVSVTASGALSTTNLVRAVVAPATANAANVKEGSIVKAVYIEMWINADTATGDDAQFVLIVERKPGNQTDMTAAQSTNLGAYPNKKNILYTTQGVLAAGIDGAQSVPVIRNWVLIPKGKQRFGLDDSLQVHVSAVGALKTCGIATFKEYT